MPTEGDSFPPGVASRLMTYVYRLIDPRNTETFYIGKGQGDRVFAHIRAQVPGDDVGEKLKRIREIRLADFEVAHVIHRHGMEAQTAFEVEAALMDAYPGLTNIAGGAGSNEYGAMHAKEIITRYNAAPAVFKHRALLINVGRTATETSLYEATRHAWKVNKSKAQQAEVVLATLQGLIIGAFTPLRWLAATPANFPGREERPGRLGFEGEEAPRAIRVCIWESGFLRSTARKERQIRSSILGAGRRGRVMADSQPWTASGPARLETARWTCPRRRLRVLGRRLDRISTPGGVHVTWV
jgi:hypothetical protein